MDDQSRLDRILAMRRIQSMNRNGNNNVTRAPLRAPFQAPIISPQGPVLRMSDLMPGGREYNTNNIAREMYEEELQNMRHDDYNLPGGMRTPPSVNQLFAQSQQENDTEPGEVPNRGGAATFFTQW